MTRDKRKKQQKQSGWPRATSVRGVIDLHVLSPVAAITVARIRELTGDNEIGDPIDEAAPVLLNAFRVVAGERSFHAGFCLGNEEGFSAIGTAVVERLAMEAPGEVLYVATIAHDDVAWDLVLAQLRSFAGQLLVFVFPNSDVYDAGTAETFYSRDVRMFGPDGVQFDRPTANQRREIRKQKAEILGRPAPPVFHTVPGVAQEDTPWIFRIVTPTGKTIRTAVWNGRRNYVHELPEDIIEWVGGEKIAIVQVDSPVGVNRRSSLNLTHRLAKDFDGIIHWARDTATFQSIVNSFVRLDLETALPPDLAKDWKPAVTIFAANGDFK
jgi:hypothetical protein